VLTFLGGITVFCCIKEPFFTTNKNKLMMTPFKAIILFVSFICIGNINSSFAQCNNTTPYQGAAAPTCGASVQLSACNYSGEYNTVTAVVAGEDYQSTTSLGDYITIRQGTPGGAVIAFGFSPLNWTATVTGNYYVHINIDATCGADATCRTSTLTHVSPFQTLTNIADCSSSVTATMNGTGHGWDMTDCGWNTPGDEEVFSFTAPTTGTYSINITAAAGGWVDFFWKSSAAGCDNAGWNCINDVTGTGIPTADVPMVWTAGVTYYILVDPEGTGAYSYTFNMVCPPVAPTGTPGGISTNLSVWFKANKNVYSDAGTTAATNGGTVQEWDELSGNGTLTKASQTTVARKPTYSTNEFSFNPVISTVHTSTQYLASPTITDTDLSGSGDITYYSVYSQSGGALNQVWNAASQSKVGFESARVYCQGDVAPNNTINMSSAAIPTLRSFDQTNATGVVRAYDENNFGGTVTNDPLTIGNYFETYTIGSGAGGGWPATAKIAEIVVFGSVHTAGERNQVSSYLALKHGITLDQTTAQDYTASDGTTEMWNKDAANASTYDNDIVGIGRDDDSELAQIKSKSVNTDAIITILAEGESTSNDNIPANNNFTDIADLEFLSFGNNNGAATWTTTGAPLNFEILTRKWLVYEEGETGTVQLDFDVADAGFDVPVPVLGTTYYLLIDTDNDGSLADEFATALTDQGGNVWRATGVNLNDGELFTLATMKTAPGGVTSPLSLWLKGNLGTTPSVGTGTLTAWQNLGANGGDIIINGVPDFDAVGYNYNPKTYFNGDNDFLSINGTNYTSLFVMAEFEDLTRVNVHINTWDQVTWGVHADKNLHGGVNAGVATISQIGYAPEFDGAGVWKFDGISVAANAQYIGTHDVISAIGTDDVFANRLLGGQVDNLPGFNGRPRDWKGDVSEYVMFADALSAADRLKVESYLALKYGKTLGVNGTSLDYTSTNGTTIWDQSNGAAYNWDVIGIGRDDIEDLNQKQSHTSDDTTRIYINTLQTLNSANAGTFSSDDSYIVLAHNRANVCHTPAIAAEVPAGILYRLEREWKVTNTNMSDSYSMDITLNTCANLTSVNVADLRLLVDADGDFTNATIYAAGGGLSFSYNNPVVTISGISTAHVAANITRYITLASVNSATPLPVNLISFTGNCKNNTVELNWTTSSEINNNYFTIEKSEDGTSFSLASTVDGNGNKSTSSNYTWLDMNPNETNYYRLKQTDFNGNSRYFNTIITQCKEDLLINVYPNPVKNHLVVEFPTKDEQYNIIIKDNLGRLIINEGVINPSNNHLINLNKIKNKGIYFITINNKVGELIFTEKLIKL